MHTRKYEKTMENEIIIRPKSKVKTEIRMFITLTPGAVDSCADAGLKGFGTRGGSDLPGTGRTRKRILTTPRIKNGTQFIILEISVVPCFWNE